MRTLTYGSLFSGIGGFDLGFDRAGMRCVWQVEIDDYCRRVLAKHWPDVRRHGDVRTFPPIGWHKDVAIGHSEFITPDVICGGPPCQRTSVAAAIQGVRTGETLWPEMYRIISLLRPRFVVVEQPTGNASWEAKVEEDLEGVGWKVSRLPISAARVGAPHLRRRVFFIADAMCKRRGALAWLTRPSTLTAQPWPAPPRGTWRTPGAGRSRMDDGFPDWLDRVRAIGNAVLPQCAEWIGRRIVEAANTEEPCAR